MSTTTMKLNEDEIATRIEHGHMRRMGHLENYFALLQRQELYANFIIGCKLNRGISYAELAAALRVVVLANPIMVHTIVPPEGVTDIKGYYTSKEYLSKPRPEHDYMAVLDKVDLSDVVINEQSEYRNIIEKAEVQFRMDDCVVTPALSELLSQICIPAYSPDKPNWRLLCLRNGDDDRFDTIIFISNHCCADAMTGINLFRDIAKAINAGVEPSEDLVVVDYSRDQSKMGKIPAPINERVNYVPSLLVFIWLLITTLFNLSLIHI